MCARRKYRASADRGGEVREEFSAAGCGDARAAGERIEHVWQEHVYAHGGSECGAGAVRGAGAGRFDAGESCKYWDAIEDFGFAAGRASGFYAEVLRLRLVFELLTRELPVLFLFDELLEGTNSHDRRIGAEGLLRALLAKRAVGIVTTHDLALTEVTAALGDSIRNVHFQDYVEDGKMRFEYKLRDGVVARSNAIELMRIVGLDV